MELSPFERGVLVSKMTEGSAAMVIGRSAAWVVRARAVLALAAELSEGAPAGVGSEAESQANPQPPAPAALPTPEYVVAAAGPMVVVQVAAAARAEPDEPQPDHLGALQRADADATGKPAGAPVIADRPRAAAPTGLNGAALAAWLYDNTDMTFAEIASRTGLGTREVKRIADGEDDTAYVAKAAVPAQTFKVQPLIKPPVAMRVQVSASFPEIPPRVIRWARWFVDARWSVAAVAGLFDVPEPELRAALILRPESAILASGAR